MKDNFSNFFDLISAFGSDSIEIQKQWNETHENEVKKFKALLHIFPLHFGQALSPLQPQRQVLDTISIEHSAKISMTRQISAQVKLKPLNLGYEILFGNTVNEASRLRITVAQVPIDQARNKTNHKEEGNND